MAAVKSEGPACPGVCAPLTLTHITVWGDSLISYHRGLRRQPGVRWTNTPARVVDQSEMRDGRELGRETALLTSSDTQPVPRYLFV